MTDHLCPEGACICDEYAEAAEQYAFGHHAKKYRRDLPQLQTHEGISRLGGNAAWTQYLNGLVVGKADRMLSPAYRPASTRADGRRGADRRAGLAGRRTTWNRTT